MTSKIADSFDDIRAAIKARHEEENPLMVQTLSIGEYLGLGMNAKTCDVRPLGEPRSALP